MKRCIYPLVISLCILLAGCNSSTQSVSLDNSPVVAKKVMVGEDELIDLNPSLLKDTLIFPLSQFAEELQIIKLEDRDEALVTPSAITLSDNYLVTHPTMGNPAKLFNKQGKFIRDVGAVGQGPGEYRHIYKVVIDEIRKSIFMLPWDTENLLVYDLAGNYKESVPLVRKVRKGSFQLIDDKLLLLDGPDNKDNQAIWMQDMKGELLFEIPTTQLDIPFIFSNELFSDRNTGKTDYHFWIWQTKADSLYHIDLEKKRIVPQFTVSFSDAERAPHMYQEWRDYFVGNNSTIVTVSSSDEDGNMIMKKEGKAPDFYIVDKKTLKGAWFKLVNDYLGGELISYPMVFQNGYYVQNVDPGDLAERIEKLLEKSSLSDVMQQKLTDILDGISDNDNNYILYAKMR